MISTQGLKIKAARKAKGLTQSELATAVGTVQSAISALEKDQGKGITDPELIIKISDALGDVSILTHALLQNPICKRIIPRAFTPLNNIKTDPSAILTKLQEELEEAIQAAKILSRVFSHADPASTPNFKEVLLANLEQLLDVQRNVEEALGNLKTIGALSEEEHLELHIRQQAKVERNGHHRRKEDDK
jgi:transcriptional regulator with XRE-family HTH domain